MSRCLVSLVGELVVPNLLLLKTLKDIDSYVFIGPQGERGQVQRLCALCKIEDYQVLEVAQFSLEDADRVLKTHLASAETEYWVNLTTGSRIVAIAAFDHFRQLKARILYLPPRLNSFNLLWPEHKEQHLSLEYRLDLDTCLQAHGVTVIHKARQRGGIAQLEAMFGIITQNSNSGFMKRLNRLGAESQSENEANSLAQLGKKFARALDLPEREVTAPSWLSFIKGAWFEEYLAHHVARLLTTADHGVVIEKGGVQNELDCAFMHENVLHIMELKASAQLGDLNDFLYKLDSLYKVTPQMSYIHQCDNEA